MIRLSETKVLDDYFIDENGIITDKDGIIQLIYICQGRPLFKGVGIHNIMMYTFYGYKKMDIHHIDKNKLNNSLNNLVYLTRAEHTRLHHKGMHWNLSEETKQRMSESHKGKSHTEEHKQKLSKSLKGNQKLSESLKGKNNWTKNLHWFNDGVKNYRCKECPEGCIPGRIPHM